MAVEPRFGARTDTARRDASRTPSAALAIAIACASLVFACGREPRPVQKTRLARLPADVGLIAVADDATSYAYGDRKEWPDAMVHNGVKGPSFKVVTSPVFSPGARKLFYWAAPESIERGGLVVDGKVLGDDVGRPSTLVFNQDGTHWATTAALRDGPRGTEQPGKAVILADGRELGTYPDASLPALSADGRHLSYIVGSPDGSKLIVDGTEQMSFAVPAAKCAARAFRRKRQLNPYFWPQFQVRYLSDQRLVAMIQDGDGWGIYRDGVRLASYESSLDPRRPLPLDGCETASAIAPWSLSTADKAPVTAWWERPAGSEDVWRVVVDGKPADGFTCSKAWGAQPPEFSSDGSHLAYACSQQDPEQRVFLIADGRRYGPYVDMWAYGWAEDGSHVAYGAAEGPEEPAWRYYVDGEPRGDPVTNVWRPLLEPGTGKLVWQHRVREEDRGALGIDRRLITSFDDLVWGPQFLRPGIVTWVIRRGRWLTRLDVSTSIGEPRRR